MQSDNGFGCGSDANGRTRKDEDPKLDVLLNHQHICLSVFEVVSVVSWVVGGRWVRSRRGDVPERGWGRTRGGAEKSQGWGLNIVFFLYECTHVVKQNSVRDTIHKNVDNRIKG